MNLGPLNPTNTSSEEVIQKRASTKRVTSLSHKPYKKNKSPPNQQTSSLAYKAIFIPTKLTTEISNSMTLNSSSVAVSPIEIQDITPQKLPLSKSKRPDSPESLNQRIKKY